MTIANKLPQLKKLLLFVIVISIGVICFYQYKQQNSDVKSRVEKKGDFYIITTYFNPVGYESRVRLHNDFIKHMDQFDAPLIVVELAYQNQSFQVTEPDNPYHIRFRTDVMLWYKENLINIAISKLPKECKYIAWMDADITFSNKNWIEEAKEALKSYKIVQLFQFAYFLGPQEQPLRIDAGFGYYFATNKPDQTYTPYKLYEMNGTEIYVDDTKNGTVCYWHPGFGWAAEKETILKMGGLIEVGIMGSNDNFVVFSMIDQPEKGMTQGIPQAYIDEILKWGTTATSVIQRKMGYIRGNVSHMWHGSYKNRNYAGREDILFKGPETYDPKKHLFHDEDGLIRLTPGFKEYINKEMINYLQLRKEDE